MLGPARGRDRSIDCTVTWDDGWWLSGHDPRQRALWLAREISSMEIFGKVFVHYRFGKKFLLLRLSLMLNLYKTIYSEKNNNKNIIDIKYTF